MLEPFIGLVACVTLYIGVWLFSKVSSEFKPDLAFEKWCASKPMLMAFRVEGDTYDLRHDLRQLLEPHSEVVNLHGGAPWQYYRYDVTVKPIAEDAVGVFIEKAIIQRGRWTERRDAADLVQQIVARPRARVLEVWMHGQLHPSEATSQVRDQRSWFARVQDGALDLHPMIGRPQWAEIEA